MKLREILKITEVLTGRKTPCDILEFLEDEYYSISGNTLLNMVIWIYAIISVLIIKNFENWI